MAGQDAAALARVVTMLNRRRCHIVRLEFHAPESPGSGSLTIEICGPDDRSHMVAEWLASLVDVVAVSTC